jgi:hypothetical protein
MHTLNLRLALYGSPAVIKVHERLQGLRRDGKLGDAEGGKALVAAVLAVRTEFGSGNSGLDVARLGQLIASASAPLKDKGATGEFAASDANSRQEGAS